MSLFRSVRKALLNVHFDLYPCHDLMIYAIIYISNLFLWSLSLENFKTFSLVKKLQIFNRKLTCSPEVLFVSLFYEVYRTSSIEHQFFNIFEAGQKHPLEIFCKKSVLKKFENFTRNCLCWSSFEEHLITAAFQGYAFLFHIIPHSDSSSNILILPFFTTKKPIKHSSAMPLQDFKLLLDSSLNSLDQSYFTRVSTSDSEA